MHAKRPIHYSDLRRLSPRENIKAGFSSKARRYVRKDAKRIGGRTATLSARQYETLRTKERCHVATPELATEARQRALSHPGNRRPEMTRPSVSRRNEADGPGTGASPKRTPRRPQACANSLHDPAPFSFLRFQGV